MKCALQLALFSMMSLFAVSSRAAFYTYDWQGDAGYSGSLVLDVQSSAAGSISDIVALQVTTPINGTLVADVNPADGFVQLADPVFTWNASQITEMGIIAQDSSGNDYLIAAQDFMGTGLNQLSGELGSTSFDEIDTGGNWVAVPEPPAGLYAIVSCMCLSLPLGAGALRVMRGKRLA